MTERIDQPKPGYYRTKLCKGGPWVPVRIKRAWGANGKGGYIALVNGRTKDLEETWIYCAGNRITERQWTTMEHRRLWAEKFRPGHWAANPRRPVNPEDI